jgi:hypothetical protein
VFGILERWELVKVEVFRDISAEAILNLTVNTFRRGSIIYSEIRRFSQTNFVAFPLLSGLRSFPGPLP